MKISRTALALLAGLALAGSLSACSATISLEAAADSNNPACAEVSVRLPEQVAELARRHPEIHRMRLVVDNPGGQDRMVLHCEIEAGGEVLDKALVASLREVTKLRGDVAFSAPGGLPNDGKVIEDSRVY